MKVLLVHNDYGKFSGEEAVVEGQAALLQSHGHNIGWFRRTSANIAHIRFGTVRAFFSGVYSLKSATEMRRILSEDRPDIVHVQNLFPLLSPSVLVEARRAGVPVVMTVQNYRLICPSGLHYRKGNVCEECCGGREFACALHNCEGNLPKSVGYALRSWVARAAGLFRRNVTMYMALTEFQKRRMVAAGFPEERIAVVPNMSDIAQDAPFTTESRPYVGYAGRISPEKGVDLLVEAARRNPEVPFRAAGDSWRMRKLVADSPENLSFLGPVAHGAMDEFYRGSRFMVLCSRWFEGFPMVLVEAMMRGTPAIAARIGGIPEIVEDGVTGLLFEPGDARDLANKIRSLWDNPARCAEMGRAARQKAIEQYSPDRYYRRLMEVYDAARVAIET